MSTESAPDYGLAPIESYYKELVDGGRQDIPQAESVRLQLEFWRYGIRQLLGSVKNPDPQVPDCVLSHLRNPFPVPAPDESAQNYAAAGNI